ncbi:MAG: hypothetical protein RIQ79_1795, partial [Verrucomicrobiota bacterium]
MSPIPPSAPLRHWSLGIRHWSFPKVLPLGLGLLLGGSATWFALRPPPPAAPLHANTASHPPSALQPFNPSALLLPPLLPRDPAAAAVSAWLSLRGPDGRPANYATRATSLRALLLQLPSDAFPRLLEGLSRAETGNYDEQRLYRIAFSSWTTLDAPAATGWAFAQGGKFAYFAGESLSAWSAKDPAAAAAWACA